MADSNMEESPLGGVTRVSPNGKTPGSVSGDESMNRARGSFFRMSSAEPSEAREQMEELEEVEEEGEEDTGGGWREKKEREEETKEKERRQKGASDKGVSGREPQLGASLAAPPPRLAATEGGGDALPRGKPEPSARGQGQRKIAGGVRFLPSPAASPGRYSAATAVSSQAEAKAEEKGENDGRERPVGRPASSEPWRTIPASAAFTAPSPGAPAPPPPGVAPPRQRTSPATRAALAADDAAGSAVATPSSDASASRIAVASAAAIAMGWAPADGQEDGAASTFGAATEHMRLAATCVALAAFDQNPSEPGDSPKVSPAASEMSLTPLLSAGRAEPSAEPPSPTPTLAPAPTRRPARRAPTPVVEDAPAAVVTPASADTPRLSGGAVPARATAVGGGARELDDDGQDGAGATGAAERWSRARVRASPLAAASDGAGGWAGATEQTAKPAERAAPNADRSTPRVAEEAKEAVAAAVVEAGSRERGPPAPRRPHRAKLKDLDGSSEDTERMVREYSLSADIDSIYAAIASGIPEAVPAVLGSIRDGQAVAELKARNARNQLEPRRIAGGLGTSVRGGGSGGTSGVSGRGYGGSTGVSSSKAYGGVGGVKEEELETLMMLAAASGNLDMFDAVLLALRQKLRTEHQRETVLEATDMDGRSLLASAAEGGNLEIVEKVVEAMGGEATVAAKTPRKTAGYFIKMAARSGRVEIFNKATGMLAQNDKIVAAMEMAVESDATGVSVLMEAAASGSEDVIDAVVVVISNVLGEETVASAITAYGAGSLRTTALLAAAESDNPAAVTAVIRTITAISGDDSGDVNVDELQGLEDELEPSSSENASTTTRASSLRTRKQLAARNRKLAPAAMRRRRYKDIMRMIKAKNVWGMTALSTGAKSGRVEIVFSVAELMTKFLSSTQLSEACSTSFSTCCSNLTPSVEDGQLGVLAYLLQHGARPPSKALIRLCNEVKFPRLKESLLGAVSSADNPFIPGMNLSVACTVAATRALEGEKRRLTSMLAAVDELLLEILEHLPQTVMGFKGEMKDCSAIFEPETVIASYRGCQGPLSVALTHRQQMETYCTTPLVLDYMAWKFTKGLPSLTDREGMLLNNKSFTEPGQTLYGDGLMAEGRVLFFGMALQRGYGEGVLSSITYFPGARFIIAGLLSRPHSYYKVPALRMVLDLATYLFVMAIFALVILHDNEDFSDWAEITFTIYILGAILTELREIYENFWEYMRDQWNVLDVVSLMLLFVGAIFRAMGGVSDISSRSCYALSAPLAFARILYFAQALPSQGPMVQVIFSMTGLLVKFGLVMIVVMLGFVMSFYSLFRETQSFGEVWQSVFKAMLGETEYFDELSGTTFDGVATVLLVVYLIILTVMMLNLLVAVLSTAHAKVDNDADLEYKVTKARLIQHYTQVVEIDRLPPPFNLVQWIFTVPFMAMECCCLSLARAASSKSPSGSSSLSNQPAQSSSNSVATSPDIASSDSNTIKPLGLVKAARGFFGRTVFWLMLGPIAVCAGWILWVASIIKAPVMVWRSSSDKSLCGRITRVTLVVFICAVGAPLWLLVMWIRGGLGGVRTTSSRILSQCWPSNGESRRVRRRRLSQTGARITGVGVTGPASPTDTAKEEAVEDASEKVVKTALEETEGALVASELQLFLDDPMSDPDVRRDEETRPTTVEHIKLLRNRLEATHKDHMDKLQVSFERATGDLSRRLERAGLGGDGGAVLVTTGGIDGAAGTTVALRSEEPPARMVGNVNWGLEPEKLKQILDDRFSELDERLRERASALENRVGAMIDGRLGTLERKLDAVLRSSKGTSE